MSDASVTLRWHLIGSLDDFVEDQPVSRVVEGTDVAIFRVNGELFALADHCTHGDARLSEGWVEGNCGECPLHQARFNLLTGEAETGRSAARRVGNECGSTCRSRWLREQTK